MIDQAPIRIGEYRVAKKSGSLRAILGSCVGVALIDDQQQLAGLAHILLPDSGGRSNTKKDQLGVGRYADTAVPIMVRLMKRMGRVTSPLAAYLAGGANMFGSRVDETIGDLNIRAAERALHQLQIKIVAKQCGGQCGRRIAVDVATGQVTIEGIGT